MATTGTNSPGAEPEKFTRKMDDLNRLILPVAKTKAFGWTTQTLLEIETLPDGGLLIRAQE